MASPAIFAVIGDSLPRERAGASTLQSIPETRADSHCAGHADNDCLWGIIAAYAGLITLALAAITALLVLKMKIAIMASASRISAASGIRFMRL